MLQDWDPMLFVSAALVMLALVPFVSVLHSALRESKLRNSYLRPRDTLPWLGDTLKMARHSLDMHDWFHRMVDEMHGKTFLLRCIGRPNMLVISSPALFEDVHKTQFECFEKGPLTRNQTHDLLGYGIFAVDGDRWWHQRKTASRLFTLRLMRDSMTQTIRARAVILADILERAAASGESIDLYKLLGDFTIDSFAEIGFGIDLQCLGSDKDRPFQAAFDRAQRATVRRAFRPSWFWKAQRWLGVGLEGQFKRDLSMIDDTICKIALDALACRAMSQDSTDNARKTTLISLFLDHVDEEDTGQSESTDATMLRDIVVNFLLAGRDTTSQALSWFFRAMTMYPEVSRKIRQEIESKLPDQTGFPTMDQAQDLVYLEAAIKESMRLHPPVPMNTKQANTDTVLSDGTVVPKGTVVVLPRYAVARLESVWGADAKEFKPERWIDDESGKLIAVSPYKFNVFHAGPRMCLGINLAMLQMKIVACGLLRKFDLEVLSPERVKYDYSLTLPIRGQLLTRVHSRVGDTRARYC